MADVSATLNAWSTTESSNSPSGSTNIGSGLDDNLRVMQAVVRQMASSNTIAAAATTDLSTVNERFITVSGNTGITALGTLTAGMSKWLTFSGAPLITHNGTSLILPGAGNIQVVAGDSALFVSLGSGNWKCLSFVKYLVPAFSAYITAATSMTQNTFVKMGFDSEDFDTRSNYNPATSRFTCADPGTYSVNLLATLAAINDTKNWIIAIYKNGALHKQSDGSINGSGGAAEVATSMTILMSLAVGDYIEPFGFNTDVDQVLSTTAAKSHFSAYKVF